MHPVIQVSERVSRAPPLGIVHSMLERIRYQGSVAPALTLVGSVDEMRLS